MKVLFSLIVLVAAVVSTGTLQAYAQAKDPASVIAYGTAQVNAHNLDALMSIFADDAVVNNDGTLFAGKEQVRGFLKAALDDFISTTIVGEFTVNGNKVTWREEDRIKSLTQIGVPVIYSSGEAVVEDGLIKSMVFTTEAASIAEIERAMAAVPSGMPSTGANEVLNFIMMAVVGAILVVAGLMVRTRRAGITH
ncbi:MAG: nuclear transport factor 2 family protein [Chloroflexia bacterium]